MTAFPHIFPVGGSAFTVELGDTIDPALNARVRALDASLQGDPIPGVLETVPSYRSLLVIYDPRVAAFDDLRSVLLARLAVPGLRAPEGRLLTVPTLYGGPDGPDLEPVAARLGIATDDVIALHTGGERTAFMLGFAPGFAYLGLLPPTLETPRRSTPRTRVPAGSVAIAGRQTAIYPVASPGGWNLIGRTSLRLFDPFSASPALIRPGDRVRFAAVRELPEPVPASPRPRAAAEVPAVEITEGGLLTTVQDAGRPGHRRLGVTWAGPMDAAALAEANARVGNPSGAAALECTVVGPALRFLVTTVFAWTGADLGAVLHRADLGAWPVPRGSRVRARAGNVLTFTGRRAGCRAYVAFAGGLDVPSVLGSRATDIGAGFGGFEGRPLRAGDLLALGAPPRDEPPMMPPPRETQPEAARVRVVLGPQADALEPESLARLLAEPWVLGADSDRIGSRLDGPRLRHRGPAEIVTDGMLPGCIQVPPDGRPIVMMADCPATGGYPKVATIVAADLWRLAQAFPGETTVRFEAVDVSEAARLSVVD